MTKEAEVNKKQENFSFITMEENILKFWDDNTIFEKSLEQTKNETPFIFYDGPPFATGLPHHGHLVGSILKDIVPRYHTMNGRYVERRFGWDCHGLPVEHEIDKKLQMSAQDAVKKLGIKGYNDECRSIVQRYTSEWKKTISRIGRWVDFENDYKTMDPNFMESIWWVFKQLWEKDLIYKGTKVMPFSTALGTILSNFEAGQNYQDVQDPAITVLFKLSGQDNTYVAAWTTTPWTLPSNLGLCVGAEIDYVKVKDLDRGDFIIIAKARLEQYTKKRNLEIIEEFKGTKLKGEKYQPLFEYFSDFAKDGAFTIFNDNYVTTDSGTGIVHLAPSFGEDDNRVMRESNVHLFACPIDDAGKFTHEVSDYNGQYVKDADKLIIKKLKDEGTLYEQSVIVHNYPYCYRSNTPLLYKAIPSWFIKVEENVEQIIKSNQSVNWVPDHIKEGRFGKWLAGARDWAVSRNRVWGTPLPIWENDETGNRVCIGSVEELYQYSGVRITDLHRENVDELYFTIKGEAGTYKRITEVLDCWFESGSMPYAQLHYPFENKDVFDNGFPAEFIAEGLDQTRGWFYTLTVLSSILFKKPAFKNVIVNGMVLAEDGKKMSKSLRNFTAPDILMDTYGADALRLYLINTGLVKAEEQRFSDAGVKDMVRRALLPWYNSFKFFQTYASIDGWNEKEHYSIGDNIVDRWVISNLQTLKKTVAFEMERYHLFNVVPALFTFIEDLTNWYIRLNRSRFWSEGQSADKNQAYSTLYLAMKELSTAMAPFAPFLAEHIYSELKAFGDLEKESIHLCKYPLPNEIMMDPTLEDAVSRMQQIILLGRQKRNQVQIKTKTPLARLTIIHKDQMLLNEIKKLENYIQKELNVKEITYSIEESKFIRLYARPNSRVLGKRLGKNFKQYLKLINALDEASLKAFETNGSIQLADETFTNDDIQIFREAKDGVDALSNRFISIDMDCHLNEDLISEGLAREVVNRIQKTRKELNFNVDNRVNIQFHCGDSLKQAILQHADYIKRETLSTDLLYVTCDSMDTKHTHFTEHAIEGADLSLIITI